MYKPALFLLMLLVTMAQYELCADAPEIMNARQQILSKENIVQILRGKTDGPRNSKESRYVITASDVGRKGYVIKKPGTYVLKEDIVFNPKNPSKFVPVNFVGGGGNGAKGFALVSGGIVRGVAITHQGQGYTSSPQAKFGGKGKGASAVGGFSLGSITISAAGTNYGAPLVVINGDGQGAQAFVSSQDGAGGITGITLINAGEGYTNATVTIIDNFGSGTGATLTVNLAYGSITGAVVTAGGQDYKNTVQAALTIKSSDVNLKFNGYTLSQAKGSLASALPNYSGTNVPSSQVPYVIGVLIPDPLPNSTDVNAVGYERITIKGKKGNVDGFSMFGVRLFGHLDNIQISDLSISNNGLLASYSLRPFPGYAPNGNPGFVNAIFNQFPTEVLGTASGTEFGVAGLCIGETDALGMGAQFFTQNTSNPIVIPYVGAPQNRISNVILKNINCLNNYNFGLCASNVTGMQISDCHFDGTVVDDPQLWAYGAAFSVAAVTGEFPSILNGVIENSTFNNISAKGDYTTEAGFGPLPGIFSGAVAGCSVAFCQNISFAHCHFDHISSTFPFDEYFGGTDQQVFGMASISNFSTSYDYCTFNDINGLYGTCGWYSVSADQLANISPPQENAIISHFQISNVVSNNQNQLPTPLVSVGATGMLIDFGVENLTITDGVISDIITNGPAEVAIGIEFGVATNAVLSHITIQRVITNQGGSVSGISLFSNDVGFGSTNNIVIDSCIVEGCFTSDPTPPYSLPPYNLTRSTTKGFSLSAQSQGMSDIFITNCKAINNKGISVFPASSSFSAGFRVRADDPYQSLNCIIENCEALDNVYGFLLLSTSNCIIRHCQADFNVSDDGTFTGEGFTDVGIGTIAAPSQSFNLFQSNNAYNNGPGTIHVGVNGNYNINVDGAGDSPPLLIGEVSNPASYTYQAPLFPELAPVRNVSLIP